MTVTVPWWPAMLAGWPASGRSAGSGGAWEGAPADVHRAVQAGCRGRVWRGGDRWEECGAAPGGPVLQSRDRV